MALYLGSKKISTKSGYTQSSMKTFFDAGGKCQESTAKSFENAMKFDDTSNVTDMYSMFYNCSSLTTIPLLDTSNVIDMSSMFSGCFSLTTIPQLDTSNVTNMVRMFTNCSSLTTIHMTGMKVSFGIFFSTKFTRDALVEILNNLSVVTSTTTLTMGSTNLAKLTDEDKKIATEKGWTLA